MNGNKKPRVKEKQILMERKAIEYENGVRVETRKERKRKLIQEKYGNKKPPVKEKEKLMEGKTIGKENGARVEAGKNRKKQCNT